jgi:hypothetical protein
MGEDGALFRLTPLGVGAALLLASGCGAHHPLPRDSEKLLKVAGVFPGAYRVLEQSSPDTACRAKDPVVGYRTVAVFVAPHAATVAQVQAFYQQRLGGWQLHRMVLRGAGGTPVPITIFSHGTATIRLETSGASKQARAGRIVLDLASNGADPSPRCND